MKPSIFCDLPQQTRLEHSSCENPLHMLADGRAGWVDFRPYPPWMAAKLCLIHSVAAFQGQGLSPQPRSPLCTQLSAGSPKWNSLHRCRTECSDLAFATTILFPALAEPGGLTEGDFWCLRDWVFLKMDKSHSGVWGQVCAVKIVFIAKGNRLHS